ncbi:MAG: HNH endonuclease [Deltaproteobacteria bacterium]|nr:HNH endonuclease [Deltaproteobacteria bacterium]
MTRPRLSKDFIRLCKKITARRPKTVIDHILKHGFITTQELKDKYGYNHPPRAVRDVKENGIPIEMFRVAGVDGRKIAAYRFGDPKIARFGKLTGRTVFSKKLKQVLFAKYGSRCAIYLEQLDERDLQIDHRIPFEVVGDATEGELNSDDFMLLCGSANRAKSWSCEHCANWLEQKDASICRSCYWAYPEDYTHIAMRPARRLDIMWVGAEVEVYDRLKKKTEKLQQEMPAYVKKIIEKNLY